MYLEQPNRFVMAAESAVRRRLGRDLKRADQIFASPMRLDMLAALASGSRTVEEVAKTTGYAYDDVREELHEMAELWIAREFVGKHWNYLLHVKHPAHAELQDLARALAAERGYDIADTRLVSKAKGKHLVGARSRVVRDADPIESDAVLNKMFLDEVFAARYKGYGFIEASCYYERDTDGSVVEHFVFDVVPLSREAEKNTWTETLTLKGNRTPNCCERQAAPTVSNVVEIGERRKA